MFLEKKEKKKRKAKFEGPLYHMHLPNPLPNDLYRSQKFTPPMVNKHKTPLTASAGAQGELGVKVLSWLLQDAGGGRS